MFFSPVSGDAVVNTNGVSTNAVNTPQDMQDRFLKLLVAQLNNQDPMNPMDNAQMTTQMAQINTVTGIQQLNLSMQTMAEEFSTMQQLQGISMIGRSVLTEGNRLGWSEQSGKGYFDLAGAATDVKVDIVTPGGVLVDTVELGALERGRQSFAWDASDYQGDASQLRFAVRAVAGDKAVASQTLSQAQVLSTGSSAGALTLTLDNGDIVNYFRIHGVL